MEKIFIIPFGTYAGYKITSRKIPKRYLERLEEDLLLEKKYKTSEPIMQELDKELKRRKKQLCSNT